MNGFETLGDFFSRLSLRAWAGIATTLAVVGLLLGGGYLLFAASTGQLAYDRLSREADLLAEIQELGEHQTVSEDTLVGNAYDSLIVRYNRAVQEDHGIGVSLHPRIVQAIFAFIPWLLVGLAFAFVPGIRAEEQDRTSVVTGIGIVALIFTTLSLFIPTGLPAWARLGAIPWGGMIAVLILFALWGRYK